MASIEEIQAKLDEIPAALDAIAADEDALKAEIQTLRDLIAGGALVTPAQMQSLMDKASAIADRVRAIDVAVP